MKITLIIIGALLLAIIVSIYGTPNTGHTIITVADWRIQTSLNFFIISILILFFLLHKLLCLLNGLKKIPKKIQNWQIDRTTKHAKKHRETGLTALFSHDWKKAQKALNKSITLNKPATIDHLAAAQAAQKLGDIKTRDHHINEAKKTASHRETDITIIQAKLEKEQQQTTQAIQTLAKLTRKKPHHKQSKKMLLELYSDLKNWTTVLQLLPQTQLTQEKKHNLQKKIYTEQLKQLSIDNQPLDPNTLSDFWEKIPRKIRKTPELIASYTTETLKISDAKNCAPLIERSLKKQWDSELIRLYGLINGKDISKQLSFAEKHLPDHPHDPILAITVSKLSIKNKLWGKSKTNLEKSLALQPTPETHQLLGHVLEQLGEHKTAQQHYKEGLELSTNSKASE